MKNPFFWGEGCTATADKNPQDLSIDKNDENVFVGSCKTLILTNPVYKLFTRWYNVNEKFPSIAIQHWLLLTMLSEVAGLVGTGK